MIDLHMHSHCSDGTDSPEQLAQIAAAIGLKTIALTDHDTISGVADFCRAAQARGIQAIAGVELSVDAKLPNRGHLHMLGYGFDPLDKTLSQTLEWLRQERASRAEKIVQNLRDCGIDITYQELLDAAGEAAIGRPHIAGLLIKKKLVNSVQEAFDQYLIEGKPGYVPKAKLDEKEAIKLIRDCGGLAVLAHPHFMGFSTFGQLAERIDQLIALGLNGVEAYYSGMPADFAEELRKFARSRQLLLTGGSDYHGTVKPHIAMGSGIDGDLQVPPAVVEALNKKLKTANG